ncbi:MAG: J domain-containing protein [Armatimonadota bacterium]
MVNTDLYQFLGVPRDATTEQITSALRKQAQALQSKRVGGDPAVDKITQLLNQAYQTLTDPIRRQQYDASLPPPPGGAPESDLARVWGQVAKLFFEQAERYTPAVDAVRHSIPLAIDGESTLILGLPPEHATHTRDLQTTDTHVRVRKLLSDLLGRPMDYRVISGGTLQDWINLKTGEELIRQRREQAAPTRSEAPARAEATDTVQTPTPSVSVNNDRWEIVLQNMVHQWSTTDLRAYPQMRAQFVLNELADISSAEDDLRAAGQSEDVLQRQLARVIDRLSNLTGIESGVISLHYLQFRATRIGGGV